MSFPVVYTGDEGIAMEQAAFTLMSAAVTPFDIADKAHMAKHPIVF